MALEAQNNPFTSILMVEAADPEALPDADPAAGQRRLAVGTDHLLYLVSDTGVKTQVGGVSGLTDPMTTRGDIIIRNASNVTARLGRGSAGAVLTSDGTDVAWAAASGSSDLAGKELDYAQITSNASITATSGATASTVISGASVAYDGSTIILIEFVCPIAEPPSGQSLYAVLYDGSTELGAIARGTATAAAQRFPMYGARRLTPSNASHTYHIKGYVDAGTGTFFAGAGTAGAQMPAFMRIIRVSS